MKKLIAVAALVTMLALAGCSQGQASPSVVVSSGSAVSASASSSAAGSSNAAVAQSMSAADASVGSAEASKSIVISANDQQLEVRLANTDAARVLAEQLQAGPVTVSLHPYGGFEQVGSLPWSLPSSDEQIVTSAGDVMLYQGDKITIFTGSNSWEYTPLGSIDGATPESLHDVLGDDAVEVTLSFG